MSVRTDRDPLVIIRLVVASYGKIAAALQFDCIVIHTYNAKPRFPRSTHDVQYL